MKKGYSLRLFRKADTVCIAATVALSLLFLLLSQAIFRNTDTPVLKIEANGGTEYYTLDKDRSVEINSNGYALTVTVEGGAAWISHSTCPDGVCRSMGKISRNGQIAVCAPAEVAVSVSNAEDGEEDTDAITR